MNPRRPEGERVKLYTFSVLLFAVIVLVILLASGYLEFGLNPSFIFVLYSICGLLASITCYGVLSSWGEISGMNYGTNVRLGGAICAFVVVAFGGGVYERYFQTPQYFDLRIVFYQQTTSNPQNISGTVTLYIGAVTKVEQVNNLSTVLFQQIPASYKGKALEISVQGNFEIDPNSSLQFIEAKSYIKVRPVNPYTNPSSAKIRLFRERTYIVQYGPDNSVLSVTFTLRAISSSDKNIPIDTKSKIQIFNTLGKEIYKNFFYLDETVIIKPSESQILTVDLLLPKSVLYNPKADSVYIIYRYDKAIQKNNKFFVCKFKLDMPVNKPQTDASL